jgi:YidC/Oxa1 family membrane protein insertase
MILASSFGNIVHPFYVAFGWALAGFYSLIPNYAIAIALLTICVMVLVFPITRRATRSMMKMQLLAPEVKKLQNRYKAQPGMTVQERQQLRQQMNDDLMALYKENNTSPTGGCLPMFLQFPVFILLYGTVRGLTHQVKVKGVLHTAPLYINAHSKMYHDIVSSGGHLKAFGIDLADSVRTSGLAAGPKVAIIAMILVAIALQYIQMKQLSGRNPAAAAANPQMQQMQKVMPIIFGVIYISIPAAVNTYFIVSSLFRIAQQEFMYRRDPQLQESLERLRERTHADAKVVDARASVAAAPKQSFKERIAQLGKPATSSAVQPTATSTPRGYTPPRGALNGQNGARSNGRGANGAAASSKSQPRAQGKRRRRPR